ncbi:MAG: hypothetical protein KF893_19945 [Caldilineaceae bacterium]|nr:hypothetical protein [Caldilineaceae bacterium]
MDTNAIVSLVNEPKSFPTGYDFCTFEKCVYEFGNGVKILLFSQQFIVDCLSGRISPENESKESAYVEKAAHSLIESILETLELQNEEIRYLTDAVKRFDLRYEFGTAKESSELFAGFYSLVKDPSDKGVFLLKRFYRLLKPKLRNTLSQFEYDLRQLGLEVISYEQTFCNRLNMLDFRMQLRDSYLPAEDLEIVFSAISQNCGVFVTDDGKAKRKGILQSSRTLGLNSAIEFVGIEEFKQGRFHNSLCA